jgi:asparagine synthetase B (glutamine-hydrolysing)
MLSRLEGLLSVRGIRFDCARWADDRFGAVNLLKPAIDDTDQPAQHAGGQRLFLDGEIYNVAALAGAAHPPLARAGKGPAAQCLELYLRDPTETARSLNGTFNLAFYDPQRRVLQLVSDRLGSRPLYYQLHQGTLYFALEQKAILAARGVTPKLDELAVFQLAAFGHQLEDRTIFEGISVMPPGSILTASSQGVQIKSYWRPAYRATHQAERDTSQELADRVKVATQRRVADRRAPLGIFLSGGLDSRCVAGALAATGAPVTAFTFGNETSRDVQFARQIAHKLQFPHRVFKYDNVDFTDTLPRVVWRTEATLPFFDCLSIELHRHIRQDAELIFNGHLGDALTGGHLLPELFWLRRRDLAEHILRKRILISKDRLRALCAPRTFDVLYDRMTQAVEHGLGTFDEERPALLYNLWDLEVRQRRYTQATPAVDRYLFEQLSPFLDNDVVEFCLSLPLIELFGQRSYLRAIVDAFPSFAQVPWARTGHVIERNHALRMLRMGGQSIARKSRRLFPRGTTPPAPSQIGELRTPGLRDIARSYVASERFPDQVFDREAASALVERHFSGSASHREEVGVLLTLASASSLLGAGRHDVPDEAQPELSPGRAATSATAAA